MSEAVVEDSATIEVVCKKSVTIADSTLHKIVGENGFEYPLW